MAEFHKSTSYYKNTPVKDFYLDLWEPIEIPSSVNDRSYIIENEFDQSPYMLAEREYGSPRLWWVFFVANPDILIDPLSDFSAGKEITIPSRSTIERIA